MGGASDTKAQSGARRIAVSPLPGAGRLVEMVQASGAMFGGGRYDYATSEALLVAPPLLRPQTVFSEVFEGDRAVDRSDGLAAVHEAVTQAAGVAFFDASSVISTDGADGVHFRPKRRGGCAPR